MCWKFIKANKLVLERCNSTCKGKMETRWCRSCKRQVTLTVRLRVEGICIKRCYIKFKLNALTFV